MTRTLYPLGVRQRRTDEPRFRIGLRVADVQAAAAFYAGLNFEQVGVIPGPSGEPVMVILRRGEVQLMADALVGMPFPDSDRERQTQSGPRGLGVVLGLEVDDLASTYHYCVANGCTSPPRQLISPGGFGFSSSWIPSDTRGSPHSPTPTSRYRRLKLLKRPGKAGSADAS